jgi:Zn-finger nucleic acid-binding protein
MLCPIDKTELKIIERQGVEIDYCPHCRGVWLDRGELDKIIEGAYATPQTAPLSQDPPSVGVWADSIAPSAVQAPPVQTPPLQAAPPPQTPQNAPQNPNMPNLADAIVPAIGGLLAGLAAGNLNRQQYGYGNRGKRKPRGWLEQMFDID